jgi:hypothetical protein
MPRILYAIILITSFIGIVIAQDFSDETLIEAAKTKMATSLGLPATAINFEDLHVTRDQSNAVICGKADGKRFVAGTGEKAGAPIIERSISTSVFNYLWNLRCQGMQTKDAASAFGKDLREEVCAVQSWNWTRWGARSIQIQGLASCQNGHILIKVFDDSDYLGSGIGRIQAQAFTVYVDRVPSSDKLRIEYATGK